MIKIQNNLILLNFEFVNLGNEVGEEDVLGVFGVLVGEEFFYVVFGDFEIVVLVDTVKNKLQDAFIVHQAENCYS